MGPSYHCLFTTIVALLSSLLVISLATGCTEIPPAIEENWIYTDLIALDPVDAYLPEAELIAIYSRLTADDIQIRLDMLDVDPRQPVDLYLFFDTTPRVEEISAIAYPKYPGVQGWEYLLVLPGNGSSALYDYAGKALSHPELSIFRDTFLDTIYIRLEQNSFSSALLNYKLAIVSTTASRDFEIQDVIGPIDSQNPPPPPANVLLTFSDVFKPGTPAQALRSWDGAHTGPDSGRHGLRYLLGAVNKYHLPVYLDGLEEQRLRSALDYLEVDDWYFSLKDRHLLVVNRFSDCGNGYAQYTNIDISNSATPNGLSSTTITEILNAFSEVPYSPIILSSPLQNTHWGSPESAEPSLAYIAGHPWIRPLNQTRLAKIPCSSELSFTEGSEENIYYKIIEQYKYLKPNNLSKLAWDTYSSLISPGTMDRELLQKNYISQVGHIFAAAQWANSPAPLADCSTDIDWDGQPECILASNRIFTTYELEGGYLAFAFYIDERGAHQLIGPSYQLSIDLGDPSSRNIQDGLLADPSQILGAFNLPSGNLERFHHIISVGKLALASPDMAIRKTFTVNNSSIIITLSTDITNGDFQIPFIIDPWFRFQSDWTDQYRIENNGDQWTMSGGDNFNVQVLSSSPLTASSFLGPLQYINHPEDPNTDYTPGYFLPFPLILMEADIQENITIQINISQ